MLLVEGFGELVNIDTAVFVGVQLPKQLLETGLLLRWQVVRVVRHWHRRASIVHRPHCEVEFATENCTAPK